MRAPTLGSKENIISIATKMNLQQRLDYIFNNMDDRRGKRFDWIYVLLDDIQSLIEGFDGYEKGEITTSSGRGLGGGSVSIPILAYTGLELVSALHAGKAAHPSFTGYNTTDNVECFVNSFFSSTKIPVCQARTVYDVRFCMTEHIWWNCS